MSRSNNTANFLMINNHLPSISDSAFIAPSAYLIGDVIIGDHVSVWFGAVLRAEYNTITIGSRSNVQDNVVMHCDPPSRGGTPVIIGEDVTIGHGAIVHGATVEDCSLIGMRSTIMDGAIIKDHSLIAAGSLVPSGKVIPSGVLAMGSPAKVVRELTDEELGGLASSANNYVSTKNLYISELKTDK